MMLIAKTLIIVLQAIDNNLGARDNLCALF
nr:MAG TPA: hypothetical protein [Microviridae sp.]